MTDWATLPDEELLAGVVARRGGAWDELMRRFERLIIGCVRNALRRYRAFVSDEDLDDIVATCILNLVKDDYKKLRSFDPNRGYKLSSWLGLIATNTALDALRRRDPDHGSLDEESEVPLQIPDRGPSPEGSAERRQRWRALIAAVRALNPDDQEFLRLYYDEELEPEEIAARLGISVNTVYSRKNKVREKLRRLVAEEGS